MWDHGDTPLGEPELAYESVAPALRVAHDAGIAAVEPPPELWPIGGAPGQDVVGREDRTTPGRHEPHVQLRKGGPLYVEDVVLDPAQASKAGQVLGRLERQPEARAAEGAGAHRIEELAALVPLRLGCGAEPEPRRDELDSGSAGTERPREVVVVWNGEAGRVDDRDAHAAYSTRRHAAAPAHLEPLPRAHPSRVRDSELEAMVRLVTAGAPDVVCLQEVPVWALRQLPGWSGMAAFGVVTMPALGGPLARGLTELDPRRLRSALTGQANAVLVSVRLSATATRRCR